MYRAPAYLRAQEIQGNTKFSLFDFAEFYGACSAIPESFFQSH